MKLAIMQPYFLPYIGYWQLIKHVDHFVIYDDVQYIKNGWVNRNRYLNNGQATYFTIPVSKGSMNDLMTDKKIRPHWKGKETIKLLKSIKQSYKKTIGFDEFYEVFERILLFETDDMTCYIENSIQEICALLDIETKVTKSSELKRDRYLRGQEAVLDVCASLEATHYINPLGGMGLYDRGDFNKNKLDLSFIKTNEYLPHLSIIDFIFNSGVRETKYCLDKFELL